MRATSTTVVPAVAPAPLTFIVLVPRVLPDASAGKVKRVGETETPDGLTDCIASDVADQLALFFNLKLYV
jgi:hypothetical protein